ncbi:MAG: DUF4380 domain-containing protein [Acidobacteria bacterium]|nr:DUF4380 domain-containing protein [Acidobacteriota bacterium]
MSLSNGLISMKVMPHIGGRVMSLSLGRKEVLYVNPRHQSDPPEPKGLGPGTGEWKNYGGSKVWVGPQGWSCESEWPGPPDEVFDSGRYSYEVSKNTSCASIELRSAHDEYSGVTLSRRLEIRPGTSIVRLRHRMENTSRRRVRWAIWQVTQVDAADGLDIFIPATGFRKTFGNEPYLGMAHDEKSGWVHLKYHNRVAKFAVGANQGWMAALNHCRKVVLAETFPLTPGAAYPDGAPTALWVSGEGTFSLHGDTVDMSGIASGCDPHVETEIMGPLIELDPGEITELATEWRLAAIESQTILSVNPCGAIARPLSITKGPQQRLTGIFGVFYEGQIQLVMFDRRSKVVSILPLGDVSPLRPLILNEPIARPMDAVRCSLWLLDQKNQRLGTIDHVQLC